jgi:hypothetical protein
MTEFVTTYYTTEQQPAQVSFLVNVEVAKALYAQYEQAYGAAVDAQCEDFDTSGLFGQAYGIGAALNAHLERAFDLDRKAQESFWGMVKEGFKIGEAITRLQAESEHRDHKNTIASVRFAMAGM